MSAPEKAPPEEPRKSSSPPVLSQPHFRVAIVGSPDAQGYADTMHKILARKLGSGLVYYNPTYQAKVGIVDGDMDAALLELLAASSAFDLIVVILGSKYRSRHAVAWTGVFTPENASRLMLCRFGHASISADALTSGYLQLDNLPASAVVTQVLARLEKAPVLPGLQEDDFQRESRPHEAALNVQGYAAAIAKFFTHAGLEECCLAIFAPWGRGKSYLMRRVAEELRPHHYQTVVFQAWKYPTRPEVWAHLYETMASAALDVPWWQKWPRVLRVGLARKGYISFLFPLYLLSLALLPKFYVAGKVAAALKFIVGFIGLGSLVWLVLFFLRAMKTSTKLSSYIATPSHVEKLGLQATIGTDLAALLAGWLPTHRWPGWGPTLGYLGVAAIMGLGASLWGAHDALRTSFTFAPMSMLMPIIVTSVMLLAGVWAFSGFGRPARVLLVVDDLDRCSLDHLIAVMESIKLLIEDKQISRRLQVVMLVEEEVLRKAVLHKYASLRHSSESSGIADGRLIRESFEKLFTVHLRLDSLSHEDVKDVVNKLLRATENGDLTPPLILPQSIREDIKPDLRANLQKAGLLETPPAEKLPVAAPAQTSPVVLPRFTPKEKNALDVAIKELVVARRDDAIGPRMIRNFIFRYQLARLLLTQLQIPWDAEALAYGLCAAMAGSAAPEYADDALLKVIRQVS